MTKKVPLKAKAKQAVSVEYMYRCLIVAGLILLALLASPSKAAEVDWDLGLFSRYSDNVGLSSGSERSDVMFIPTGNITLTNNGPRLFAELTGRAEYFTYMRDTFDDDTRLYGDAIFDFHVIPDLLDWRVEDHLSNEAVVSEEVDRPSNRQNVNVFFTGPEIVLRPGDRHRIDLTGGYSRFDAETSRFFDGDRVNGQVSWDYTLTARLIGGLNAEYEDVAFDHNDSVIDPPLPPDAALPAVDYERTDYYASTDYELGANVFRFEGGISDIAYSDGVEDDKARLFGQLTRQITENSTLDLVAQSVLTDASRTITGSPSYGLGRINVSGEVFELKGAQLTYEGGLIGALEGQLAASNRKEEYLRRPDLDRKVLELSFDFETPVASRTTWTGAARWGKYDYETVVPRTDKETWLVTGLNFSLRRHLEVSTEVGYHDINSSDSMVSADEMLAQVGIVWSK